MNGRDPQPPKTQDDEQPATAALATPKSFWQKSIDPEVGLSRTLIAVGFVILLLFPNNPILLFAYLALVAIAILASIIAVALLTVPPEPLKSKSILVNRFGMLTNNIFKSLAFCAAGVYGALVAIPLETYLTGADNSLTLNAFLLTNVFTVVAAVAGVSFLYTIIRCGLDIWRSGKTGKAAAIGRGRTLVETWLQRNSPNSAYCTQAKLLNWLEDFAYWCTKSWRPFISATLVVGLIVVMTLG